MHPDLIRALRDAKAQTFDSERPAIVERIRKSGKLTPRERIDALLDPGSASEIGAIAARAEDGRWVAEAGGVDFVGAIDGKPVVTSSTDYTDHGGGYGASRHGRLIALAREHRWPLIFFVDGGGSRARHPRLGRHDLELSGLMGRFTNIDGMAELSGWVPTVCIVSGPSFAGHASLAGFSDFLIATPGSSIGMGGPPMVEAALGKRLTPHELAPVEQHEVTGGIDRLVDDEPTAIQIAKRYVGYFYDHDEGRTPDGDLNDIAPDPGSSYDMHDIVAGIVDQGSLFELRENFAPQLITAFARLNGRSVGVLANNPAHDDARVDESAAIKIARFVEICDCYELPILTFIDTPGTIARRNLKDETNEAPTATRTHARALMAHQQRTVPLVSIHVGRQGGLGPALMTGYSSNEGVRVLALAWPSVTTGERDPFSTVYDQNAFDDIVEPAETRSRILNVLRHMPRRLDRREKKHPVDSW